MKFVSHAFASRISPLQYLTLVYLLVVGPWLIAQQASQNPSLAREESAYHRKWQIGGYAIGGWPPDYQIHGVVNYEEEVHFYATTFEAGRTLTGNHGIGLLRGQAEAVVDITPFWVSHEPAQTVKVYCCNNPGPFLAGTPGGYYHGLTVTPFLLRWNFRKRNSSRLVPWVQGGTGLLWTTKVYPQYERGHYPSRFNFIPQFGAGESFFVRKNQSIDLGVRFEHITSWGLGEYNPGISALQFTAGYSWWK